MQDEETFGCDAGVICVLVGLPGSGKSTLCSHLMAEARGNAVLHVEFDAVEHELLLMEEKHPQKRLEVWHRARDVAFEKVEEFLESNSTPGKIVLVDDNMYYQSMRMPYLQLARRKNLGFLEVFVKCELEDALKRNAEREKGQRVEEATIRRMNERIEPPCSSTRTIAIDSVASTQEVWEAIQEASKFPEKDLQKEIAEASIAAQETTNSSASHQFDLEMRKAIGLMIRRVDEEKRAEVAVRAAKAKAAYYVKVKPESRSMEEFMKSFMEESDLEDV